MTTRLVKTFLPLLLVGGAAALALLMFLNRPDNALLPPPQRSAEIDVAEITLQSLRIPISTQGTVTPHRETVLVAEVAGKIVQVSPTFHAGGYLAKGEVLLKIDDRNYRTALLRTQAEVESAESSLALEKGRGEVAYNEWQKLPANSQRSQEATDLYLRKPQLDSAQAQLLSAQANYNKAKNDLERTVIRAPYRAIIRSKRSDLGQYVSPGTPLAEIFAVDFAEVRLAISQGKLNYLELPDINNGFAPERAPRVDLYADLAGETRHWTGRLQRTEAVFDERSRVLFAVARVDDPYGLQGGQDEPLRMGTFVEALILGREMHDLAVLPRQVLRAGDYVWVVDERMTLRNRKVRTLSTEGRHIYVSSGLQDGDLVSLTALRAGLPGMPVQINKRVSTLHRQDTLATAEVPRGPVQPPADTQRQVVGTTPSS